MRSMCRIRPDMSRMAVGDGHGNGPQPRPPMNQLGHVVLRVRYRPENLIDGIQDARHQPHVRCQAAPTQILRQARVVLFRFWVDRGAALLESATGEMTYLLLCKPHHLLFDRDGGGESSTRGLWYSMCTGKMVRATSFFSGTWNAEQKQTKKSKEKGNEQVRIKAKRAGTEQERKEREMLYCNSTQLAPLSCTFSLYVLSTDLGAATRCLNDLQCAELSKGDSGKKQERRN